MKYINRSILAFVFLCFALFAQAQNAPWEVPDDAKGVNPTLPFTAEVQAEGQGLFQANCKSCHGEANANMPLKMTPTPPDLASAAVLAQTDGAIYYKLTKGRGAMAAFEKILTADQRWSIVAYLRTFDPNYAPSELSGEGVAVKASALQLQLSADATKKTLTATVRGKVDTAENTLIAGQKVKFMVKRTFGNLAIGEVATTNKAGIASVEFPADLPGDSIGVVEIVCEIVGTTPLVTDSLQAKIGTPKEHIDLLAHRAMWGTRANGPLWIMFLYLGITGGVWITIFYVVSLMFKIIKQGKK